MTCDALFVSRETASVLTAIVLVSQPTHIHKSMQSPTPSTSGSLKRLQTAFKSVFSPRPERLKRHDVLPVEKIEKTVSLASNFTSDATSDRDQIINHPKVIKYKHAAVQTDSRNAKNVFYATEDIMLFEVEEQQRISKQLEAVSYKVDVKIDDDPETYELPKLLGRVSIRSRDGASASVDSLPKARKRFIKFDKVAVLKDAASNGDLCELRSLLEGDYPLHIDACSSDGVTALHTACSSNQFAIVEYLLKLGAHVNAVESHNGNCPLHEACIKGNLEMVQLLVQAGASVEATNLDSLTPAQCTPFADVREYLRLVLQKKMVAPQVTAIYDFNKLTVLEAQGDEMSMKRGEMLTVLGRDDQDWWLVQKQDGSKGMVPRLLVQ